MKQRVTYFFLLMFHLVFVNTERQLVMWSNREWHCRTYFNGIKYKQHRQQRPLLADMRQRIGFMVMIVSFMICLTRYVLCVIHIHNNFKRSRVTDFETGLQTHTSFKSEKMYTRSFLLPRHGPVCIYCCCCDYMTWRCTALNFLADSKCFVTPETD